MVCCIEIWIKWIYGTAWYYVQMSWKVAIFHIIFLKKNNVSEGNYLKRTTYIHSLTLLVAGGGGCFYPPLGFFLNISQTAWARILKFSDFFSKTNLGILPETFKLIAATGAVPGPGNLGGDIRKVSFWAIIVICIEHNCLCQLSKRRQQ